MHLSWAQHLKDPAKKAQFQRDVKAAYPILSRLNDILDEEDKQVERWLTNKDSLDKPNWDNKLAFANGDHYRKEKIKELILSVKETKPNDNG